MRQVEVLHGHVDKHLEVEHVDLDRMRATVRDALPALPVDIDLLHVESSADRSSASQSVIVVVDYTASAAPLAVRRAVRDVCERIAASPGRYGLLDATVDTTSEPCDDDSSSALNMTPTEGSDHG